jgi:hypothetical protein
MKKKNEDCQLMIDNEREKKKKTKLDFTRVNSQVRKRNVTIKWMLQEVEMTVIEMRSEKCVSTRRRRMKN